MDQINKYQLVRKIAQGGMAEVFLGRVTGPHGFEKAVVVKRMLPDLASDPGCVEMFLSEARVSAKLSHPNIVQIFDFGEANGAYFIAMEYIDGPNLRAVVRRAKGLSPGVVAKLISLACEGLAYAHDFVDPINGRSLGLIHRDVSPENIMLTRQGALKLVDFGIVKAASEMNKTRVGTVKGKVAYMAPEQIRGEVLDRRTDIYALGVSCFELLTGHRPHELQNEIAMMHAILTEPPARLSIHRQDVPDALQKIIDKALSKKREERYSSCRELQADLDRFLIRLSTQVGTPELSEIANRVMAANASLTPAPPAGAMMSPPPRAEAAAEVEVSSDQMRPPPQFRSGALTTPMAQGSSWMPPKATPQPIAEPRTVMASAVDPLDDGLDDGLDEVPKKKDKVPEGGGGAARIAILVVVAMGLVVGGIVLMVTMSSDPSTGSGKLEKSAAKAALNIECNLPCKVRINQKQVGESKDAVQSVRVSDLEPKASRIEVFNENIKFGEIPSFSKSVSQTLKAGENGTLKLTIKTGKVDFSKIPEGTTVIVSGKTLGKTPLAVTEMFEGPHLFELVNTAKKGIADKSFEFSVVPDVTTTMSPP